MLSSLFSVYVFIIFRFLKYIHYNVITLLQVDNKLELTNQFLLEVSQKMLQNDGYNFAEPLSSNSSEINNDWTIENKLRIANFEKGGYASNLECR